MNIFETAEGDISYKCEDYHLLNIQSYCRIDKDNKHIITTIVDYVRKQKHYRKVFENDLESKGE